MCKPMKLSIFQRRVRHPFFPQLAAIPADWASGVPAALAGTFVDLERAATRGVRVRRAVYVLTRTGERLSDGQRDELWDLFQVPVYALLMDRDGHVIACECEAQDGMHLPGPSQERTCACGRPGARMVFAQTSSNAAD